MEIIFSSQLASSYKLITLQLLLFTLCNANVVNHKSATPTNSRQQQSTLSSKYQQRHQQQQHDQQLLHSQSSTQSRNPKKPNIILFLTDDQDVELGSLNFMPKTLKNIRDNGAEFDRAYATTPMCCPSRSSLLTGMYVHNHHVFTNKDNCSSPQWQATHETRSFATYLSNAGYRTGYFGKYLNKYNGTYIPPGWREWGGLIMNSKYYNYSINMNGQKIKHGFEYEKDYYTDVITSDSITFLRNSKKQFPHKPLMLAMAFPAPHGPEDSAPQYSNLFFNITAHHTPSYDFAPNPDKQWILKVTDKMQPIHKEFTDLLMTKRLQTLQSVDDSVERVIQELKDLDELDNTYIVYTSDHGYHLGQFGLIKGKSFPFEFDVRIPFLIRGPGILPGRILNDIVLNIDLAPTFLDMAGVEPPRHMDGRSILPLFANPKRKKKIKWPDTFLIESSGRRETPYLHTKQYQMELLQYSLPFGRSTTDNKNNNTTNRNNNETISENLEEGSKYKTDKLPYKWTNKTELLHSRIKRSPFAHPCDFQHMKLPCRQGQKWYCQKEKGRWHRHKCKFAPSNSLLKGGRKCLCFTPNGPMYRNSEDKFPIANNTQPSESIEIVNIFPECTVIKGEVKCSNILYQDEETWLKSRLKIDGEIYTLKQNLEQLKKIKKHLKYAKPRRKNNANANNTFKEHPYNADQVNSKYKIKSKEYKNQGNDLDNTSRNSRHRHRHHQVQIDNPVDVEIIRRSSLPRTSKHFLQQINNKKPKFLRNCYCEDEDQTEATATDTENNNDDLSSSKTNADHLFALSKEDKRKLKQQKKKEDECHFERMTCFEHNNDHWRTEPKWTSGPFCFCMNANNNTYSCLRTINAVNDFLYCEFITGFITFYNLRIDPSELKNRYAQLKPKDRLYLKELLKKMVACKGSNCSQQLDQTKFNLRNVRI